MLVIRCTRKLLNRLPAGIEALDPPTSTTKLGDWYGNPVGTKYRRLILFVSEKARLPVLIEAKDLKNSLAFRLRKAVGAVIANLDDIPPESVRAELDQMQDVVFAKTASRSVLGTINDYTFSIRDYLYDHPDGDTIKIAMWLVNTPILSMGGRSPKNMTIDLLTKET